MNDSENWKFWEKKYYKHKKLLNNFFVKSYHKITKTTAILPYYANQKMLNRHDANDKISNMILSNEPMMVSRYGSLELKMMIICLKNRLENVKNENSAPMKDHLFYFCKNTGFFPNDISYIDQYTDLMLSSALQIDLLGTWNLPMEEYIIDKYMRDVALTHLIHLEPWLAKNPWSIAFKGKKILIIHPFVDTIQKQYLKRDKIFKNKDILPEFKLETLKAVQTIAGLKDNRFDTWFEALDYMYESAIKIDFDIAIIGCGAYGLPLAAKLKMAGKQAIHLGGATQLMFGIKGKRWEQGYKTKIATMFNNYWVSPSIEETPKNAKKIEEGCYW